MKKLLAGFVAMALIMTSLIGCSDKNKPNPSEPPAAQMHPSTVEYNMNPSEIEFLDKTVKDYYTDFATISIDRFNSFYKSDASDQYDQMKETMDLYDVQNIKLRQTGGYETYENYAFLYVIYDMKIGNGSWMPMFEYLVLEKNEGNWKFVSAADVEEMTQSWVQSRTMVERDNTWFTSLMEEMQKFNEYEFNKRFLETKVALQSSSATNDTAPPETDPNTADPSQSN